MGEVCRGVRELPGGGTRSPRVHPLQLFPIASVVKPVASSHASSSTSTSTLQLHLQGVNPGPQVKCQNNSCSVIDYQRFANICLSCSYFSSCSIVINVSHSSPWSQGPAQLLEYFVSIYWLFTRLNKMIRMSNFSF